MLKVKCRTCGKETIWNDFQESTVKCPKCGDPINLHKSFKDNINLREFGEEKKKHRCPKCKNIITRKYIVKCPSCGRWVIGKYSMSGKWFVFTIIVIIYLLVSIIYHNFGLNENPRSTSNTKSAVKEWLYRQ